MIPEGQAGSRESSAPKCIDARYVSSLAPFRPVDGHKGTFGTLLIRAGSPGMGGAAVMCCEAGLRSGTGLVRLYSDRAMAGPILGSCPQALFTPLPDSAEETITVLDRLTADSDAVVFDSDHEHFIGYIASTIDDQTRVGVFTHGFDRVADDFVE